MRARAARALHSSVEVAFKLNLMTPTNRWDRKSPTIPCLLMQLGELPGCPIHPAGGRIFLCF